MASVKHVTLLLIGSAAVGILMGFLIGWFSNNAGPTASAPPPRVDPTVSKTLMEEINSGEIEKYLEYLTAEPHIAGRDVAEVKLVDYIKNLWTDFGLHVEVHPYEVLLSYPDQEDSNLISILLDNGTEIEKSTPSEKVLESDKVVNPFNAYSATGDVMGNLVYVNYGRVEDFIRLTRDLGVDPSGHVCISRYGRIFRGSKAYLAQEYGCKGLIIYSDPIGYTVPYVNPYPDSWFLPGTGAQRGNLQAYKGDPLTPQYPALDRYVLIGNHRDAWVFGAVDPSIATSAMLEMSRSVGNAVKHGWKPRRTIIFCSWGAEEYGYVGATEWVEVMI